jgi:RHS repeat-associated protein
MLKAIEDRHGNRLVLTRDTNNRITQLRSPTGRTLAFTYDASHRITAIADQIGRTVSYTYDGSGRLSTVTDARGGVTTYTYDASHRMETIEDARGIVYLTNTYDANGRVSGQELADGGEYTFAYTLDVHGRVVQTDVTNPRGVSRRTTFNAYGYALSDTLAYGAPEAQTTTYVRASPSNFVTSETDPLGRETTFTYDSLGNLTSATRLAGTAGAVTTTFTYEPVFQQVKTVTDPLNHTVTFTHDSLGAVIGITDPLAQQTTLTYNWRGQPETVTNALNQTGTFGYTVGDLISTTTPLGHTSSRFLDSAGRARRTTDPIGGVSSFEYDAHDQPTTMIDALGGATTFTYDGNGNLVTLTDARGKTTTWTYDNMDRVATRTDPLTRAESFAYDPNGNLTSWTDRKGQVTTYTYDALDRQLVIGFGTTGTPPAYASTVTTTYDAGNRATQIVDSGAGTITRTYDLLDRLTQEVTPEGTISYTYDAADRRATMQVAGQTAVAYTYDAADRLTAVTQGTASVAVAYDAADRRTSLTLPNGIGVEHTYDDDSQLTGLTYKLGGTTLGDLTYTYDANGQRTAVGGSWARSNLPAALTAATYDDANQIATWASSSFSYDANGNLTGDGIRSYTWNARNELTALSGPVSGSFEYDAVGRRRLRTVGSNAKQYLYDGLNPVQELASGTPVANLLTGLGIDEYFTRTDSAGVLNYLTDALGSSIALADGTGAVQTEHTYEPFGSVSTSGASTGNTFGFTGREADGTGLYFYRARYYDPRLQRFSSWDPIDFTCGDTNLFAYSRNSPVTLNDPMGTCPPCQAAVAVGRGIPAVARAAIGAIGALLTQISNAGAQRRLLKEKCYEQWLNWARCRQVSDPQEARECWTQAAERYALCIKRKQVPPLFPWDEPWK